MTGKAILILMVAIQVVTAASWTAAGPSTEQFPNLVPLPPYDIRMGENDEPRSPDNRAIEFSVSSANRGAFALELTGVPTGVEGSEAYQCISWVARVCIERQPAGAMAWHEAHQHWHFEGFASYELRALRPDGTPDLGPSGLVASSGKVSFCLQDTVPEEFSDPNQAPVYRYCTRMIQGISPGWVDIYDYTLPGQEVPLSGVDDGTYALVVRLNPDDRLRETRTDDNVSFALVGISGPSLWVET
jgi:hypothetical protein